MEDKKRKKEDKRKREVSQKAAEPKNKVPEPSKPVSAQSAATPSSASPSPGPAPSSSPSPVAGPPGGPAQGGGNGKRSAVANGQPASGSQPPQRYMSREVPPRFRCQQDHKVLLKRGQPPLSCMLLGGGSGGGDGTGGTAAGSTDASLGSAGPAAPLNSSTFSSSSSIAASSSNYANSTWGVSSGSQPPSQGWEKVIVDGSDLEEWPSIVGGAGADALSGGAETSGASWSDKQKGTGAEPSISASCPSDECMQVSGGPVWGSSALGTAGAPGSKASSPEDALGGGGGGMSGANFNPSANPSAWPALVQDEGEGPGVGGTPTAEGSSPSVPSSPALDPLLTGDGEQVQRREWGGPGAVLEIGTGPKTSDGEVAGTDPSASWRAPEGGASGDGGSAWGWGTGGEGSSAPGASQGAGEDLSVGEWGCPGVRSLQGMENASEAGGSSTGGSSGGNGDNGGNAPASPTGSSMTRVWDNQSGTGEEGAEWVSKGGVGPSSCSSGGRSRGGSHRTVHQPTNPEVALQNFLKRTDLDPRVLSNSGWGQTQIRQNVAWDFKERDAGSDWGGGSITATDSSVRNPKVMSEQSWGGGTRGAPPPASTLRDLRAPQPGQGPGGWGGGAGKGWAGEGPDWRDRREWTEFGQQGMAMESTRDGWEDKGTGGWGEAGWGGRNEWEAKVDTVGRWGEGKGSVDAQGDSEVGSWSNWEEEGGGNRGWGVGGEVASKPHPGWGGKPSQQISNSKAPMQQQDVGGWPQTGPPQNQSTGWNAGPVHQASGAEGEEISGWEEPSPQSISRKMEIDDGTAAWGDPSRYNTKSVNLWDKNSAGGSGSNLQAQNSGQQTLPTARATHPSSGSVGRDQGNGSVKTPAMGPAMWGASGAPGGPAVDNGTGTWGKATDTATGWGEPGDSGKTSGWGNPSPKSSSKSMQEGWGDGDASMGASRHSSWEEEEDTGGMWNSTGSQGSSSSYNSGGWGQSHVAKKGANKVGMKSNRGESWMDPMTRQFSNMGLLGEDHSGRPMDLAPGSLQDKKLDGEKRGMNLSDYNGEMRKGGRGGGVFRSPGSKDVGSGETGSYYDKPGSHSVFGSAGMSHSRGVHQPGVPPLNASQGIRAQVPHQFLSPQVSGSVLKQMPPPNSSVGGIGVGGGMFPAQLSPQHFAMLSNLYPHMQQVLACQLLLQQQQQLLQNQRKFPQTLRQQPDPQQLARVMAILQQQKQQGVGGGGASKLSPSHFGGGAPKQQMGEQLPHPGMVGSLADLHSKTQGGYSGFSAAPNLSGLDLGSMSGSVKESGGQQSRFKWFMEAQSPAPSPPDSALHKNGPMSTPGKLRGGSPYSQFEVLGGEGLGVGPQGSTDSWHRTPGSKASSKSGSSSWPPEFQPGVPWKGIQSADPESDPYVTPGSVLGSSGVTSLNNTEHQLLRDNAGSNPSLNTLLPSAGPWPYSASESPLNSAHNSAKYEYKTSWPPEPIGHNKPWKSGRGATQPSRPPPGLTNQKHPSPWAGGGPRLGRAWSGTGTSQDVRYGAGSAWSDGVSSQGSCWLLLSNLTPQIDGSTLRTICMQHGPLLTFHLGLTQGTALIRYSTRQEAAKAQSALHMCVLGNTTILAEFVSEEDVAQYFAHSQAAGGGTSSGGGAMGAVPVAVTGTAGAGSAPGADRDRAAGGGAGGGSVGPPGVGWQSLEGSGGSPDTSAAPGSGLNLFAQWSNNGVGGGAAVRVGVEGMEPARAGLWGGVTPAYPSSSLWGTPPVDDRHQMDSPAALLPGDLLGGGADSI